MPYLKSSSKTGTELKLYRSEIRDLNDVSKLATWIAEHHPPLKETATKLAEACAAMLAETK